VVATCVATTFFSHDLAPPSANPDHLPWQAHDEDLYETEHRETEHGDCCSSLDAGERLGQIPSVGNTVQDQMKRRTQQRKAAGMLALNGKCISEVPAGKPRLPRRHRRTIGLLPHPDPVPPTAGCTKIVRRSRAAPIAAPWPPPSLLLPPAPSSKGGHPASHDPCDVAQRRKS